MRKSIYPLEILLWISLGIIVVVVTWLAIHHTLSTFQPILILWGGIAGLVYYSVFYLLLMELSSGVGCFSEFLRKGIFAIFLTFGDLMRNLAFLIYNGDKPVNVAFGRALRKSSSQPRFDAEREKKPYVKPLPFADRIAQYIASLSAGEYFIITIEHPGGALAIAKEILLECPGAKHEIFIGRGDTSLGPFSWAEQVVLVIGELDKSSAAYVTATAKYKPGTKIYQHGIK